MGQKVHPEAMRVGYIHDWKSNWFNEKNFAEYLAEDIRIRRHITDRLAHAGLSDITIRKDSGELEVNIHTARPGIVIGKSGTEVDALRRDLHRMTQQADQGQHPRDQAPRARREARRAVDRRAAAEPRRLPPRDEARAHQRDALRAPRASRCRLPGASAAPRWRAPRATPTGACRCTRCAPTSTTASTRPRPRSGASA